MQNIILLLQQIIIEAKLICWARDPDSMIITASNSSFGKVMFSKHVLICRYLWYQVPCGM